MAKETVKELLWYLRTQTNMNPICVKADVDTILKKLKELVEGEKYNKCNCKECDMCGYDLGIDKVAALFEIQ